MANRLLFEKDIIRAVDRHTNDDSKLDDDISCILEEVETATIELPPIILSPKVETKPVQKQRRVLLFENENLDLEQRGSNRYYLSLYDKEGKFQREVTIDVKDDYSVELRNCK